MNLNSVLALNGDACLLMEAGNYRAAGKLLVDGLAWIRRQEAELELASEMESQGKHVQDEREIKFEPVRIGLKDQGCSSFYLYNWSLLVTNDTQGEAERSANLHNVARICASLLFNTGVCFQAIGMLECAGQAISMQKALRMYNMAMSLLDLNYEADRLIQLAALNNKGCIMASFCDQEGVQNCLASLQYLLTTIDATTDVAQREDMLEIRMNVALLYGEPTHSPAA
ncbi:hypothetical protein MPSEU_000362800 [Mayamaea pseudoterrestris]|nr:hypothetical protein MPSEU_000362800 [Mayamaea pseudoterrestris]